MILHTGVLIPRDASSRRAVATIADLAVVESLPSTVISSGDANADDDMTHPATKAANMIRERISTSNENKMSYRERERMSLQLENLKSCEAG